MTQEDHSNLARRRCVPCRGGISPLKGEPLLRLHRELDSGWALIDDHHIEKRFKFPDFAGALAFTNAVGAIAEEQNHHPDILLAWGNVTVTVWTHKINGLTESDFIFAAKTEEAYAPYAMP
ncbi:MAG TPA: 4a-hydroxytetrahydrobiopterin dehydratase [Candidatus Hydrogenedentes bacterium]|nr:4a-hydroxytetrahydrobiopterin dehydratase [Candidatus Hydrogenedentota bacterium]HNT88263.1 4a-hydroxytetrahydrobiopterin dehydratase [Candidatus Hydrogenedentota bacterium]